MNKISRSPPFFFSFLDKFWYCRLSPNHKVLHYGDLEESPQGEVPHDSLQDKRKYSWAHQCNIEQILQKPRADLDHSSLLLFLLDSACGWYQSCCHWEGLSTHEGKGSPEAEGECVCWWRLDYCIDKCFPMGLLRIIYLPTVTLLFTNVCRGNIKSQLQGPWFDLELGLLFVPGSSVFFQIAGLD